MPAQRLKGPQALKMNSTTFWVEDVIIRGTNVMQGSQRNIFERWKNGMETAASSQNVNLKKKKKKG